MKFTSDRNEDTKKLEWGISPPVAKPLAYGARAIFSRNGDITIDYVWDRQCMVGGTADERKAFGAWLDKVGTKTIRKLVKDYGIYPNDAARVSHTVDGVEIEFSPKRSYGYLYIGAWPSEETLG